jgi:2-(1,2-epoxy-1,2-dihydrophenyl)acetyl-CoA isomerase
MGQFMAGRLRGEFNPVATMWCNLPVPLVVALNGVAAGAGASIALMGDITVAARSASLAFLFAPKLGLAPDMGATHFLARRVGEARARAYALTGEAIPAETAAAIGLIAECVDDDRLMARAEELARRARGRSAPGLPRRARSHGACRHELACGAARARGGRARSLGDSPDFLEGVAAFREKRTAKFQAR